MKARAFGLVATFVIGFFVLVPSWSILQPDGSTVRQAVLMDVSQPIYELMAADPGSPQPIEPRFDPFADNSSELILPQHIRILVESDSRERSRLFRKCCSGIMGWMPTGCIGAPRIVLSKQAGVKWSVESARLPSVRGHSFSTFSATA